MGLEELQCRNFFERVLKRVQTVEIRGIDLNVLVHADQNNEEEPQIRGDVVTFTVMLRVFLINWFAASTTADDMTIGSAPFRRTKIRELVSTDVLTKKMSSEQVE